MNHEIFDSDHSFFLFSRNAEDMRIENEEHARKEMKSEVMTCAAERVESVPNNKQTTTNATSDFDDIDSVCSKFNLI